MDTPIVLRRRGLRGMLPIGRGEVRMDPAAGRIEFFGRAMELKDLRHLEIERGFLNLGTDRHWETIDLFRWRSGKVPLTIGRALSPAGVQFIEALKAAIGRNRQAAEVLAEASEAAGGLPARESAFGPPAGGLKFDFRFLVRIDRMSVILTIASVGLILLDLQKSTGQWQISFPQTGIFLLLVVLGIAALFYKRGVSRLHFDDQGVARKGVFRSRTYPWSKVREYRRQHGEMEIVGDGFRMGVNLEILAAGGTPLILRRSRFAMLSLPGRLFLGWLPGRVREVEEPAFELSGGERIRTRLWIGALVILNSILYLGELYLPPQPLTDMEFMERLVVMGARTHESMHEPWRFVTALFLHGSTFHLITNMLALAVLGHWIGWIFGWTRGMVLYLASGVLGNLIAHFVSIKAATEAGGTAPSVGASTSILGLLGALMAVTCRRPERIPLAARARFRWAIPLTLLLTLGLGLVIPVLDNGAHLGGFVAGLALAWFLPPKKAGK